MKFVAEMSKDELEAATFGIGFKRDAQGRPIEQGRGAPGNPHKDSQANSEQQKLRELQRNALIQQTIEGKLR